jgi:signal transduction histidine kinase/ligand-binding sensor domain-containing protein
MRNLMLAFLIYLSFNVFGEHTVFLSYNTENGMLMHNSVETIARDRMGYVWIGTNYGLNRLDGYQTINYIADSSNSTAISSNFIKSLFVDSRGDLWIGTIGGGLNKYDREFNGFIHFLPSESKNSISGNNVSAICEDKKGNLWIGTLGKGVNKFDPKTGIFTKYKPEYFQSDVQKNSNVSSLHCDTYGNIWVGFDFDLNGVYKINVETEKISFHGLPKESKENPGAGPVTGIAEMKDGTLLFAIWDGKLFKIDPEKDDHIILWKDQNFFDSSHIKSIAVDKDENIWVCTWENGLYKIDSKTYVKSVFKKDPSLLNSLSSNSINTLFVEGNNLWIGFREQGVNLLLLEKKMFNILPTKISGKNSEEEIDAHCLERDSCGNIWIGCRGQGLWKYNTRTGEMKNFCKALYPEMKNDNILTLKYGQDGILWIGTDGDFICAFDPVKTTFKYAKYLEGDWSSVYSLSETDSFIYCGTWGAGIKKVNKRTLTYQTINFDNNDQYRNSIFDIEKSGNTLWIANVGMGLISYDISNGKTFVFRQDSILSRILPRENINDIFIDKDQTLWLATNGAGLVHFNPVTLQAEIITQKEGLTSNVIQAVVADNRNNLWISSNSGVTLFNKSTLSISTFYTHNGLPVNNLNISASVFDPVSQQIYVGTTKGAAVCNSTEIQINHDVRPVIFTMLSVMGKIVLPGEGSILKKPIDQSSSIFLSSSDKLFTLSFSSMEFSNSFKSKYYYKLDGFDKEWIESPYSKNVVQYTNLDPGKYMFRVKSSNNDGVVGKKETTIQIIIKPAFWQTVIFKAGIIIILILLFILAIYRRDHKLIKSKLELELNVADRTSEIEFQKEQIERQKKELEASNKTKDKFFSIIGHDLKNPMSSIDQLLELLVSQSDELNSETRNKFYKVLKDSSARTLNLLDDLMVWAMTQTNRITINKQKINISELIHEIADMLDSLSKNKNIRLVLPEKSDLMAFIDKNSISTVLRNLITNAIKFSAENSKIEIEIREEKFEIFISVIDHGIGMSEADLEKLFKVESIQSREGTKGETGTGLGLILCKEFVAFNGGSLNVESKKGKGSTFTFSVEKADN